MDVNFGVVVRGRVQGVGYRAWAQLDHREHGFLRPGEHRLNRAVAAVADPAFDAKP